MNLTALDIINLISSLASLILSVIAIWLALYFYHKSKDTEKEVNETLTEIKTHTGTLERLTGKWMDRFTRYVTTPQRVDEMQERLLQIISFTTQSSVNQLPPAPDGNTKPQLTEYLVSSYLALYYYAGLTNIATQFYLPKLDELEPGNTLKNIVDRSHADFVYLENLIASLDQSLVQNSQLLNLYNEGLQMKGLVKDSTMVYQERAGGESAQTEKA